MFRGPRGPRGLDPQAGLQSVSQGGPTRWCCAQPRLQREGSAGIATLLSVDPDPTGSVGCGPSSKSRRASGATHRSDHPRPPFRSGRRRSATGSVHLHRIEHAHRAQRGSARGSVGCRITRAAQPQLVALLRVSSKVFAFGTHRGLDDSHQRLGIGSSAVGACANKRGEVRDNRLGAPDPTAPRASCRAHRADRLLCLRAPSPRARWPTATRRVYPWARASRISSSPVIRGGGGPPRPLERRTRFLSKPFLYGNRLRRSRAELRQSSTIRPSEVSTTNIMPGCSRPLARTPLGRRRRSQTILPSRDHYICRCDRPISRGLQAVCCRAARRPAVIAEHEMPPDRPHGSISDDA